MHLYILAHLLLGLPVVEIAKGHPHPPETSFKAKVPGEAAGCTGTESFYICVDGLNGCFLRDPCLIKAQVASAEACGETLKPRTIFEPTMFNVFPAQPNLTYTAVNRIQLDSEGCAGALEQAIVFKGIPRAAKSCTLKWAQSTIADRVFSVKDSGLVALKQLSGFPAKNQSVSARTIQPFEPKDRLFNVDFTSWDQIQSATTHIGGPVKCDTEIYLKAAINTLNGAGHVYFEQDAKNGFYIEYSC